MGTVATGPSKYLLTAILAAAAAITCVRRPIVAAQLALVVCASLQVFSSFTSLTAGPLSVYASDVALALVILAAVTHHRTSHATSARASRILFLALSPFLVALVWASLNGVVQGEGWQLVGVSLRVLLWYVAAPLFALFLVNDKASYRLLSTTQTIAALVCLLVAGGLMSSAFASLVAGLAATDSVTYSQVSAAATRLYIPGMVLVPLSLGAALARPLYGRYSPSRSQWLLLAVFVLGLLATFGRGMLLSTVLGVVLAVTCRLTARSAVRFALVLLCVVALILAVDFAVRGSDSLPSGLLHATYTRMDAAFTGDPNVTVRLEEMRLVVEQTRGHELFGRGITVGPGYDYGAGNWTVHNGYFSLYGRLGALSVAAFVVYIVTVLVMGVLATRRATGFDVALAFGGLTGFTQGVASSWTQPTNVSLSGIVAMALAAAFIALVYARTRPGRRGAGAVSASRASAGADAQQGGAQTP